MSQINPSNINGQFPVFGQDNATQGFRDNFTNIKQNFTFAKTELEELQTKVVLKSALEGQTLDNNMYGSQIVGAQFKQTTQSYTDYGDVTTTVDIDFSQGNFQKFSAKGDVILSLSKWPATSGFGLVGYASVRVWMNIAYDYVAGRPWTVSLPKTVSIGINDLANADYTSNPQYNILRFDVPGDYVFDISSADGGVSFLIFDNTRNRVRFRDPSFYFNPDVNPTLLIGFQEILPLAIQIARTSDVIEIYGSMSSYGGILEHGNQPGLGVYNVYNIDPNLAGNANTAGYSVTTSRAFVDPTTGRFSTDARALVASDDYVGYFNFIGLSLDPTTFPNSLEGAFTDFASMRSYVNGLSIDGIHKGNLVPGGNLVIMTKRDGLTSQGLGNGYLHPALSLENDQSAHMYGDTVSHAGVATPGYQLIDLDTRGPSPINIRVFPNVSVTIISSTSFTPVANVNLMLPPHIPIKDGHRITITSEAIVGNVHVVNSETVLFENQTIIPATQPGFPPQYILTVTDSEFIQEGLILTTVPYGNYYTSNQIILKVLNKNGSTATLLVSGPYDNAPTPLVTPITLVAANYSLLNPSTLAPGDTYSYIYNKPNNKWYKI